MTAPLLFPHAEKVRGYNSLGLSMVGGPSKVTHHITVSGKGTSGTVIDLLKRENFEPTLLLDPYEGGRYQFLPPNKGAYALEHPAGMPETNRQGKVHIQIEWLWKDMSDNISRAPYFMGLWADVCAWSFAWGVPHHWPFGGPLVTSRSASIWKEGGHAGHRNAPGNTHVDSLAWPHPIWAIQGTTLTATQAKAVHDATAALKGRRHHLAPPDRNDLRDLIDVANKALNIPPYE
jgi:hypothetical protein